MSVETADSGPACGYRFERGKQYLVYARREPNGTLTTGLCSRTRLLAEAGDDLSYLRTFQTSA